ncbi:MAG: DUF3991 and TOPRIM domain-containing protein [Candidatus Faecousia sp.]|nr:DUF3991 and TOPRIM domain-containing protein [Candidatus Faecousia sp.]
MAFIPPETIEKARQVDLLTYLQTCEPNELVHISGNHYCTREHDSLKISNGKWYWFSRGFGGYNALDYLIKVKEVPFMEAVERITGQVAYQPQQSRSPKTEKPKVLLLPQASRSTCRVHDYLRSRGIDSELIDFCIQTGRLYESSPHHNAVFVGLDKYNKPRNANLRGLGTDFIGDANGSDKRFSFSIPAPSSDTVHLFESAIDLLSYATIVKTNSGNWNREHLVSLAGVYKPKEELQESSMPLALKRYLSEHPNIRFITLRLDNDATGGRAAKALVSMLSDRYEVSVQPPPYGKDYNDYLCMRLGLPITHRKGKAQER